MEKAAVEKAQFRLEKARTSLGEVKNSTNFEAFEAAWTDLLLAGNTIYLALKEGAKGKPQSKQWSGAKHSAMRKDPLLNYMHQARNADEHGIESVTAFDMGGLGPKPQNSSELKNPGRTEIFHSPLTGWPPVISNRNVRLVTVHDWRFGGASFDPPTEHLGKPLTDASPFAVAELWVRYLGSLVEEASRLA